MTREESKNLMKRIKEHYQEFIVDEGKIDEWHNFLKDYSYHDVSKKLDEHLSSQDFGQYIPKVTFLTKYLTKEKDKGKIENHDILCYLCNRYIKESEYQKHFLRCSSIDYMNRQRVKYFRKEYDEKAKKQLWNMEEEIFRKKYREVLEFVKESTKDEYEKERVSMLLDYKPFTIQQEMFNHVE